MKNDSHARPGWRPTRRAALQGGLAGAALAGLHSAAKGAPLAADPVDYRRWLIDRTTFGWTPAMDAEVVSRGWYGYLQWQFDWKNINDGDAKFIADQKVPTWTMTPFEANNYMVNVTQQGFTEAWMWGSLLPFVKGWLSQRQLLWVMTDFWSNYFNRFLQQEFQQPFWQAYEHTVFYSETSGEALGSFPEMLRKSAKGASMLLYLNLFQNTAGKVNENYARELMELHSVGLDPDPLEAAFTEAEVLRVAEILTGWRGKLFPIGADLGDFYFDDAAFDFGPNSIWPKTILGKSYPKPATAAGGEALGYELIGDLAGKKSTAKHVTRRLAEWLIGDGCPNSILDKAQAEFELTGGDIPSVLIKLLEPDSYYLAQQASARSYRRPLNLVTAFCRATTPVPTGTATANPVLQFALMPQLAKMGQRSGFKPSPDGYPGENEPWYGALQPRLETINALAHTSELDLEVPIASLVSLFGSTPVSGFAQRVNDVVAAGLLPATETAAIQQKLDDWASGTSAPWGAGAVTGEDLAREALALVFSSPSMQFLA